MGGKPNFENKELLRVGKKRCTNCKEIKTVEALAEDKRHSDGLQSHCRKCQNLLRRTKYREKVLARAKEYHRENREKQNARKLEYYYENHEYLKKKHRGWMEANREAQLQYKREYHQAHREEDNEKAKIRTKKWIAENPERHRENVRRRMLRKKNADGFHTEKQWQILLELCDRKCLNCGSTEDLACDHIVPLSKGGTDWIDNVQPLCQSCNSTKYVDIQDHRPKDIRAWAYGERMVSDSQHVMAL